MRSSGKFVFLSNNVRFFVFFECKYFALLLAICHSKGRTHTQKNDKSIKSDCFIWTAMLFCSHAVKTTVETGPDLATSSDSKCIRIWPSRKSIGFKSFHSGERIQKFFGLAGRIQRMRVYERHIRKEKFADSKYPDTCEKNVKKLLGKTFANGSTELYQTVEKT